MNCQCLFAVKTRYSVFSANKYGQFIKIKDNHHYIYFTSPGIILDKGNLFTVFLTTFCVKIIIKENLYIPTTETYVVPVADCPSILRTTQLYSPSSAALCTLCMVRIPPWFTFCRWLRGNNIPPVELVKKVSFILFGYTLNNFYI